MKLEVKHEQLQTASSPREEPEVSLSPSAESSDYLSIAGTSTSLLNTLASSLERFDYNDNYNGDDFSSLHKSFLMNNGGDFLNGLNQKNSRVHSSNGVQSRRAKDQSQPQHSFSGRHVMWTYFDVGRQHTGYYYCRASPDCNSAYTWPPSTTVAGRHVRDRHPEVYAKIMNEHAARKSVYETQFNHTRLTSNSSRKRNASALNIASNAAQNHASSSSGSSQKSPFSSNSASGYSFSTKEASATFEIRPTKLVKLEEIINGLHADERSGLVDDQDDSIDRQSNAEVEAEINKRTCELESVRAEMTKLKEQESSLRLLNQHTSEQLLDVQAETSNLRARNEHLEKRQKDFNSEIKLVREELAEVKEQKSQLEKRYAELECRSKGNDPQLQALKAENAELRASLTKTRGDLDELLDANLGKSVENASDEELANIREAKRNLEAKLNELENELEDAVIRNQSLEDKANRLETANERLCANLQREENIKEVEMNELRTQCQRRIRTFEEEINELNDTNSSLLKQNRVLESRIRQIETQSQASSLDLGGSSQYYKRQLRKALALLRDTQAVLAHERGGATNNAVLRQLKEQLEDAENAKLTSLRTRHNLENELSDLRSELELANAAKSAAEEKVLAIMRDKNAANTLAQEHDEQLQDLLKKHKAQLHQGHLDAITLADQTEQIANLERNNSKLQEQLNEASANLESNKIHTVEKHKFQLLQLKLRDLQAKLDLETSHMLRFESITTKLKNEIDCLQEQLMDAKLGRDRECEALWKAKKDNKLQQEEINELKRRESDLLHRYKSAKTACDQVTEQHEKTKTDLRLALKRIDTLQATLNADLTAGSDIEEEDENDDDERDVRSGDFIGDDDIINGKLGATATRTASFTDDESNGRRSAFNGSVC